MASDDVELVREAFELLDSDRYEAAMPLIDERFEMVTTAEVASQPDTYRGRDGVRRWWQEFLDAMETVRLEARELHPAGEGLVIVEFAIRAWGKHSGIETAQPAVALATLRDGKLMRLEFFTSVSGARAAAQSRSG